MNRIGVGHRGLGGGGSYMPVAQEFLQLGNSLRTYVSIHFTLSIQSFNSDSFFKLRNKTHFLSK